MSFLLGHGRTNQSKRIADFGDVERDGYADDALSSATSQASGSEGCWGGEWDGVAFFWHRG
jgi:hypothetical protein